jgi:hypothetical protein
MKSDKPDNLIFSGIFRDTQKGTFGSRYMMKNLT